MATSNLAHIPDFKIDKDKIPEIKIKNIHAENFKAFSDAYFDFLDNGACKPFICFHGPNGTGKSTILDIMSLLFSRFDGRDNLHYLLGKSVRHIDGERKGIFGTDDFLLTANLQSSIGDYEVKLNKNGFIQDHPREVKEVLYRLFFYARFDMELHQFQLERKYWDKFKILFEGVTGFTIEEDSNIFINDDPMSNEVLDKYVLGFLIHKPYETIHQNECSAGERKIIKSFSTLLNKEYNPAIACIDNIEMHVATERHINLIESMKKCFSNCQIFATTHSYQISRNFGEKNQLYDLRLLKVSELLKKEPWRLYLMDEIKDNISKVRNQELKEKGYKLISKYSNEINIGNIQDVAKETTEYIMNTNSFIIDEIIR